MMSLRPNFSCSAKTQIKLLLLLLVLSSATCQDNVEKNSQHQNVSLLNPDLVDIVPETIPNISIITYRHTLPPVLLGKERKVQASSPMFINGKLKWQTWSGSLPNGAVSIYNKYVGRIDYVCKHSCNAGFHNPDMGSYCYYPYEGQEYHDTSFEILVNEGHFEILEWKDGSYGSVPPNSIRTCSHDKIYVGRNKYGLGKVDPKNKAFYLPWKGSEYWYSWFYQVLTIKNDDIESEHIDNIMYNTNNIFLYSPEIMQVSVITNNECSPVSERATLSKTYQVENRWDISSSFKAGNKTTLSAGIPHIVSSQVEISSEISLELSKGNTVTEEVSHFVSLELKVPPNHQCKVRMIGHEYKLNIPFTAQLSRTNSDGETRFTSIIGTYNSIQVGEVHVKADQCVSVYGPKSCK